MKKVIDKHLFGGTTTTAGIRTVSQMMSKALFLQYWENNFKIIVFYRQFLMVLYFFKNDFLKYVSQRILDPTNLSYVYIEN